MFCLSTVSTNDYIKITGISFSKKGKRKTEENGRTKVQRTHRDLMGPCRENKVKKSLFSTTLLSHFCPSQPGEEVGEQR